MNTDELNPDQFEAYVSGCSERVKEILGYLRTTAHNAGTQVMARRYKPKSGCGITFYVSGEWFCQFHPKPIADHVQVLVREAFATELAATGSDPAEHRADGQLWIPVKRMHVAVRLVPLILRAHDSSK